MKELMKEGDELPGAQRTETFGTFDRQKKPKQNKKASFTLRLTAKACSLSLWS